MNKCIKYCIGVFGCLAIVFSSLSLAEAESVREMTTNPEAAFTSLKEIVGLDITVPTVVNVLIEPGVYASNSFLVLEKETGRYIGSYFERSQQPIEQQLSAVTSPSQGDSRLLTDDSLETSVDFSVNGEDVSRTTIVLSAQSPITAATLSTQLAMHVALPLTVSIRAEIDGQWQTVVTERRMTAKQITFPETVANRFEVTFSHIQPLRIAEMSLQPIQSAIVSQNDLRFLAQPGMSYVIFIDADRSVRTPKTETGDLRSDVDVLELAYLPTVANQQYIPADIDSDGVPDSVDNCVTRANPEQVDLNANSKGDMCEDFDRDGRDNPDDNCPNTPNRSQADEDGDGIGDVCDEEESRFTERNAWVPWAGIGMAASVLVLLFVIVVRSPRPEDNLVEETTSDTPPDSGAHTG